MATDIKVLNSTAYESDSPAVNAQSYDRNANSIPDLSYISSPQMETSTCRSEAQESNFNNLPKNENSELSMSECSTNVQNSGSKKTPKKFTIRNPFRIGAEELRTSYISPNVFTCKAKSSDEPQHFSWSIDQIAAMKPADIDESSHQDSHTEDSETEELAQTAINEFFSQGPIAPSPWMSSAGPNTKSMFRPHVTFSPNLASTAYFEKEVVLNSTENSRDVTKEDASTQTTLSIPFGIDLERIIGHFYTFMEIPRANKKNESVVAEIPEDIKDMLSSSSLRRKLFDHRDDDVLTRDPRFVYKADNTRKDASPPISPVCIDTPPRHTMRETSLNTPDSSSPITPYDERKSSGIFSSNAAMLPSMSPIAKSVFETPSAGSLKDEGIFRIPRTPPSRETTPIKSRYNENDSQMIICADVEDMSELNFGSSMLIGPDLCQTVHSNVTGQFESLTTLREMNAATNMCSTRLVDKLLDYTADQSNGTTTQMSEHDTGYQTGGSTQFNFSCDAKNDDCKESPSAMMATSPLCKMIRCDDNLSEAPPM